MAGPRAPDPFTEMCNRIFEGILKATTLERPPGPRRFLSEFSERFSRSAARGPSPVRKEYLDQVLEEWSHLPDPKYHQAVLKYPVPEAALETIELALRNELDAVGLEKLLRKKKFRGKPRLWVRWAEQVLDHPKFRDPEVLGAWVRSYRASVAVEKNGVRYLTGIPVIPGPKKNHVRMFKGTNFYSGPAISKSQAEKPAGKILSGEDHFLTQPEANVHSVRAEAFHPDGVSASLDKTVILNYGSHVRIYDIPESVFEKLPRGALGLDEYVFRYSIPEKFRVMTLPKSSYVEALKEAGVKGTPLYFKSSAALSDETGGPLLEFLRRDNEDLFLRGDRISYSEILNPVEAQVKEGLQRVSEGPVSRPWTRIDAPPNVDVRRVAKLVHALRRSGEVVSSRFKGRATPAQLTTEILQATMERLGCSRAEIDLGKVLAEQDVLGQVLAGEITPQVGFERFVEAARGTNLTGQDLYELQSWMRAASPEGLPAEDPRLPVLRNLFEHVKTAD